MTKGLGLSLHIGRCCLPHQKFYPHTIERDFLPRESYFLSKIFFLYIHRVAFCVPTSHGDRINNDMWYLTGAWKSFPREKINLRVRFSWVGTRSSISTKYLYLYCITSILHNDAHILTESMLLQFDMSVARRHGREPSTRLLTGQLSSSAVGQK